MTKRVLLMIRPIYFATMNTSLKTQSSWNMCSHELEKREKVKETSHA